MSEDFWGEDPFTNDWNDCEDRYDPESDCIICGDKDSTESCCCCASPLCHMHFETHAGFCPGCPTKEWIEENE